MTIRATVKGRASSAFAEGRVAVPALSAEGQTRWRFKPLHRIRTGGAVPGLCPRKRPPRSPRNVRCNDPLHCTPRPIAA